MATIWFDVTTILLWARPPTGVVRVEAELFKRLARTKGSSIRFCAYERATQRFIECQASEVEATLTRNSQGTNAPAGPSRVKQLAAGANELLRKAPLPVYRRLASLKRVSEPVVRTALHQLREARQSVGSLRKPRAKTGPLRREPTTIFARGDVVVSAGLDWDFKDLDVLFALKKEQGFKVISVCYDLIPVLLPHACREDVARAFPRYFADVAWCADLVLCISESTRRDFEAFVREVGAPQPKTGLLTLGATLEVSPTPAPLNPAVKEPFLLFVSTIERRKNHDVLYRALVRLAQRGQPVPTLVLVGMPGWGTGDLLDDVRRDPRVAGKIIVLERVSDDELTTLYQRARFTLYPSLYEGWGLPVAEALAHGKFCLSANTSSLPEVGGALVEYLDPWNVDAWADRIAYFVDHPDELRAREAAIAKTYVPHRWEATAEAVLAAAKQLTAQG